MRRPVYNTLNDLLNIADRERINRTAGRRIFERGPFGEDSGTSAGDVDEDGNPTRPEGFDEILFDSGEFYG